MWTSAGGVVGWEDSQFPEFFASQYGGLRRLGFLLTGDWSEGEELAQDALVRVYWRWTLVRRQQHPEAYARKVLINRHRSLRRRLRREARHAGQARVETADPGQREELLVVWAAIGRLPTRQRAVVVLRYHEDLPELEVARLLQMPVGTVKSTANRALARLRKELAGRLVDHANTWREPR
jgi:RNA polymerase sigma-70 factor (sigma-E family)